MCCRMCDDVCTADAVSYTHLDVYKRQEYGISRFDPDTHAFENFFFSAYALGNVYSENSGCVSKDGKLMFGSNYGLVVITPGKIVNNSTVTPMACLLYTSRCV